MAEIQGKEFFRFVVESFGGLGKDALKLLDLVSLEGLSLGFSARMTKLQFRRYGFRWTASATMLGLLVSGVDSFDKNIHIVYFLIF